MPSWNSLILYTNWIIYLHLSSLMPCIRATTSFLRTADVNDNQSPRKGDDDKDKVKGNLKVNDDNNNNNDIHLAMMKHLEPQDYGCKSRLYCRGDLLTFIQRSKVFNDAKTFVDMPSKRPVNDILEDFEQTFKDRIANIVHEPIPKIAEIKTDDDDSLDADIKQFLVRNFDPPGTEMRVLLPSDWNQQPTFLNRIKDKDLLMFARAVHEKWRSLLRDFDQSYLCSGCVASSFKLPSPFIIPGGRFREFYYWDSYWILEGLYTSEMCKTARGMVDNMLAIVERFGFVPNGSRVYYLNRSQPPMLTLIIKRFMESCYNSTDEEDKKLFLERAYPLLQQEHAWWIKFRTPGPEGLASYKPHNNRPRPESFLEDELAHEHCPLPNFYQNIAGGAESGWDFSSRWFLDYKTISSIRTGDLFAVDLNSILYRNERTLSEFARDLNLLDDQRRYEALSEQRVLSMHKTMWNGTVWLDYDYRRNKLCDDSTSLYISSLAPLWFDVPHPNINESSLMDTDTLLRPFLHFFEYEGGVPISTAVSGQQWDFPNVWAPMQHLMMKMLLRLATPRSRQMAVTIAQKWINSTYCGYHKHGQIFEKYHAQLVGEPGGGGEYIVQEGFGWSNGVILWTLSELGPWLTAPKECPRYVTEESPALVRLKEKHDLDMFIERQDFSYKPGSSLPLIMMRSPTSAHHWSVQLHDDHSIKEQSIHQQQPQFLDGTIITLVSLGLLMLFGIIAVIYNRYYPQSGRGEAKAMVDKKKSSIIYHTLDTGNKKISNK